ncbi:hypothetical protein REC12_19160 [Desulfosporosinus sp. PR]|nr:hypothetical protein [Desulfosporosinus sp. PR]
MQNEWAKYLFHYAIKGSEGIDALKIITRLGARLDAHSRSRRLPAGRQAGDAEKAPSSSSGIPGKMALSALNF